MRKLMTVLAAAAVLTGCTGSNPIQRELGQASHLELTNRTVVPDERNERDAQRILARWAESRQPVTDVELERPL